MRRTRDREDLTTSFLNPYLNFVGNVRQAMEFYQSVLGGTLTLRTYGELGDPNVPFADQVMHGSLEADQGFTLMGSDLPPGADLVRGNSISVCLNGSDAERLRGYWEKLSSDATVSVPLERQTWGDEFGACVDRFGVSWMVVIGQDRD
ncbi:VOC family protein [Streptoalloteichus hindustanus]|uniref:PhnB protein n=1 Tax=Streptoalloteichus hindustanus TaxID=2017 RepID=A0A1M5FDU1_STRHI|nr:VOC family protein [Streptoalloteichus hindustanus]SHF89292.1 PhnB protein [Streptoalloteichus hindustanus]